MLNYRMLSSINVIKYALESCAIVFVTQYLLGKDANLWRSVVLAVTLTVTHIILDTYAPVVGQHARIGAGFGIGLKHVGGGCGCTRGGQCSCGSVCNCQRGGCGCVGGGGQIGGMDDAVAIDYYKNNRIPTLDPPFSSQSGGMDDTVAIDYYSNNRFLSQKGGACKQVQAGGACKQVGGMDDKVAIDYYSNNRFPTVTRGQNPSPTPEPSAKQVEASAQEQLVQVNEAMTSERSSQVNVMNRFMDDRAAFAHHGSPDHSSVEGFAAPDARTAAEVGLVYGTMITKPAESAEDMKNVLYSQDLVDITNNGKKLVMGKGNFVKASKSGAGLFKLRFLLATEDENTPKMSPIRYQDPVKIVFNNEKSQTTTINHDGNLNALENNKDVLYELINQKNPSSESYVRLSEPVYLRRRTTDKNAYLKVKSCNIGSRADLKDASVFVLQPVKGCGPLWRHK